MPATARSWRITEAYRRRIANNRKALQVRAEQTWPVDGELTTTKWDTRMAAVVKAKQAQAVRRAAAYLDAYVASETGLPVTRTRLDASKYAGLSRDGRPLTESLRSPLVKTLWNIKQGEDPQKAIDEGKVRAARWVGVDFDHAHRQALLDAIKAHPQTEGWVRAVAGTCGACAAISGESEDGVTFEVHPGCQCVSEPEVETNPDDLIPTRVQDTRISADGLQALEDYANTGYTRVNEILRGRGKAVGEGKFDDYWVKSIDDLDQAFQDALELPRPTSVYRGVRIPLEDLFPKLKGSDLVGKVITDPGYSSTTTQLSTAQKFADIAKGGHGDLWRIRLPGGQKVVNMGTHEGELLLNKGAKFKITRVHQTRTYREVFVEVLP